MKRAIGLLGAALILAALPAGAGEGSAALVGEVRAAETAFAASMARRDLDGFAAFVADEAVFLGRTRVLRGKAAVVEAWRPLFADPAAPFSWEPGNVEVLASGTLALSTGPVRDQAGKQVATFSTIWRRESDGRWRVVFDQGCPACDCPSAK